jgi:cytochrome c
MNSMEVNKIFAAILTAGIAFSLAGFIGSLVVRPERLHHSAIRIGEVEATAAAPAPAEPAQPIGPLLASADVAAGERLARQQCGACHSFDQGGRNGVGPNLYDTIGKPHGHVPGFAYSAALRGKPGAWNYEEMSAWLLKPSAYAPGTRMAYAGLAGAKQRADVIAYLRSLSPNPQPLP